MLLVDTEGTIGRDTIKYKKVYKWCNQEIYLLNIYICCERRVFDLWVTLNQHSENKYRKLQSYKKHTCNRNYTADLN